MATNDEAVAPRPRRYLRIRRSEALFVICLVVTEAAWLGLIVYLAVRSLA